MTITIYTTPNCQQCKMTKSWLDQRQTPYNSIDLSTSPDDLAAVKALGYAAAPVIIVNNGDPATELHWAGFDPASLQRYTQAEAAA